MEPTYETPSQHIDLLTERGYLSENFKAASKVGYWLREFAEQYEQAKSEAIVEGGERRFQLSIGGKFYGDLEQVNFLFRYRYHPDRDVLELYSLYARLGRATKTIDLSSAAALPEADVVYKHLRNPRGKENDQRMYVRLYFQYLKERDPGNDYVPDHEPFKVRRRF